MMLFAPEAVAGNPVPSRLALRRIRFQSVGPDEARLDPLDLHLTALDGTAAARTLLALTNTGGKTTLITLVCSVLVTAAKHQVGKANIGEYVQTGDTSHVVLEWEAEGIGRFVTGAVYEWPNRTRPSGAASISDLKRAWYMFRSDGVSIDDLPFNSGDRKRRTLEDFHGRLDELFKVLAPARFVWTSQQGEWARVLDDQTPLDPELFRYQMRMNDQEGGAGALVKRLTSGEEVVRFFVESLNDGDALNAFTSTMRGYAESSGQRHAWELEAEFCAAMVDLLDALGAADNQLNEARTAEQNAGYGGAELVAALRARAGVERQLAEGLERQTAQAGEEVTTLGSTINRNEDIRAQLRLEQARFEMEAAEEHLKCCRADLATANLDRSAWHAVAQVQRLSTAKAAQAAAQLAYQLTEGELAPLREQVDGVAADLAAKYAALAHEADDRAAQAQDELDRQQELAEQAERGRDQAVEDITTAKSALEAISTAERKAKVALDALVKSGVAKPAEQAADAELRWKQVIAGIGEQWASATRQQEQAEDDLRRIEPDREVTRQGLEGVRRRLGEVVGREARFAAELGQLNGDEALVALAGGKVSDVAMADRIAQAVQAQASQAEEEASNRDAELRSIDRELGPLESGEVLSTVDDVEVLCTALVESGIGSVTGWQWLAHHADPVQARQVIATHPELANGIIITDPARLDDANRLLSALPERPRLAVLVSAGELARWTEAAEQGDLAIDATRFTVEPHRALWDRKFAQQAAIELRGRRQVIAEQADGARQAAATARRVSADLDSFVKRWIADPHDKILELIRIERSALAAAERELAAFDASINDVKSRLSDATQALRELAAEKDAAMPRWERAREAATLAQEAATAGNQRAEHGDLLDTAKRMKVAGDLAAAEARSAAKTAQGAAATALVEARAARDSQARVGVEPAAAPPLTPILELVASLEVLRDQLGAAEQGSGHAERLNLANRTVAEARSEVDVLEPVAREAAEGHLGSFDASNSTLLAQRVATVDTEYRRQVEREVQAEQRHSQAEELVRGRSPEDRQVHIVLPDELVPADAPDAAQLLQRVNMSLEQDRERHAAMSERLNQAKRELAAAQSAAKDFSFVASTWHGPIEDESIAAPFPGSTDDASTELSACADKWQQAQRDVAEATTERGRAHTRVRTIAASLQYASLVSALRSRCQDGDIDDIAPQAAVWARDARIRAKSLAEDLADLDRHRDILVGQLQSMCDTQLRMLREVTRSSRMPVGLGDLTGKPAFKIDFDRAPAQEVHGKLAARVDDWATVLAADPKRRPEATRQLADALRDMVKSSPNGAWRVQVLKPSVDFDVAYRTPDRVEHEYSGGQELTMAVLLYCTLAHVRAQNRTSRQRPPGVLIADNPFGAASNPALIRMQQALAACSGIQLVCATGLDDPGVLSSFEGESARVVRLRNDRDQRRGLHYLRIEDPELQATVRASVLGGHGEDTKRGYLSATSYSAAVDVPLNGAGAPDVAAHLEKAALNGARKLSPRGVPDDAADA